MSTPADTLPPSSWDPAFRLREIADALEREGIAPAVYAPDLREIAGDMIEARKAPTVHMADRLFGPAYPLCGARGEIAGTIPPITSDPAIVTCPLCETLPIPSLGEPRPRLYPHAIDGSEPPPAPAFAPNVPIASVDYARDHGPIAAFYAYLDNATRPEITLRADRIWTVATEPAPTDYTAHGLRLRLARGSKPPATVVVRGTPGGRVTPWTALRTDVVIEAREWSPIGTLDDQATIYGVRLPSAGIRVIAGETLTICVSGGIGTAAIAARIE